MERPSKMIYVNAVWRLDEAGAYVSPHGKVRRSHGTWYAETPNGTVIAQPPTFAIATELLRRAYEDAQR